MNKNNDNRIYILEGVPVFKCFSCNFFCSETEIFKRHLIVQHNKCFDRSSHPFYKGPIPQIGTDITTPTKQWNDQVNENQLSHFYSALSYAKNNGGIDKATQTEKTMKKVVKNAMTDSRFSDEQLCEKVFF